MYFKKAIPSDKSKKYIKCYWIAKEDGYRMIREINPSANICVCFHIGHDASYKLITKDFSEEKNQTAALFLKKIDISPVTAKNTIIGPHRNIIIESSANRIDAFGIEFKTGIRKRFFGKEIVSLTDKIIPLDYTNTILSELANIISKCNKEEIFDATDNYLTEKYLPIISHKVENDSLLEVINQTILNPLSASVETMSAQMNMSKRNFERLFKQFTGLTPKQFIGIQRVNMVCKCMIEHQEHSLMEILEFCEYYDQAHINRDFHIIGGLPATQIFQNFKQHLVNSPDALCLNNNIDGVCGFNTLT